MRMKQNSFHQKSSSELHFVALLAYIAGGLVNLNTVAAQKLDQSIKTELGVIRGKSEFLSLSKASSVRYHFNGNEFCIFM